MARVPLVRPDWLEPGQHLARCPKCDYLLRGLPETSRCPECGSPYDKRWGLWRDGSGLVMARSAALPLRCVKCGAAVTDLLPQRVVWKHPAILLVLLTICVAQLGGLLLYVLVSLALRRTATVHVGLCPRHRRRRSTAAVIMGAVLVVAGVLGVLAVAYEQPLLGVSMATSIFLAVGIWLAWGRTVRATRIDRQFIRLAGVHEAVLSDLPHLEGFGSLRRLDPPRARPADPGDRVGPEHA